MNSPYRIGVDVGGTNTDAVLMRAGEVVVSAKRFTTADVKSGVIDAIEALIAQAPSAREQVSAVMIGTTQFVNAFIQRRDLARVAVIRVALPKGDGVPPMSAWPDDLTGIIGDMVRMVRGGAHYTGEDYIALDEEAVRAAAIDARAQGIRNFAISAVFAPLRPDLERRAAAIVRAVSPGAHITCSSDIGGIGLIDRENAAIINASLAGLAASVIPGLRQAFAGLAIDAPVFISQNDGTLISTETASALPILTCSAGPTNSIRGAAFLTGSDDAIVVDIGGTTADVGVIRQGFPRETTACNDIGGVRTNFRMPDLLSIGLGGGSRVGVAGDRVRVGPQSVGFRLQQEALIFGGTVLTATDIAVAAGQADIGDRSAVANLDTAIVEAALGDIHAQVEDAIDQVKTSGDAMPLILVGGGSILIGRPLRGVSTMLSPAHADVANAVGAAIAQVSGRVDKLFDTATMGREPAIAAAKREACAAAVAAGARADAIDIVEISELPMTHMQAGATQIKVRAVGPLAAIS